MNGRDILDYGYGWNCYGINDKIICRDKHTKKIVKTFDTYEEYVNYVEKKEIEQENW